MRRVLAAALALGLAALAPAARADEPAAPPAGAHPADVHHADPHLEPAGPVQPGQRVRITIRTIGAHREGPDGGAASTDPRLQPIESHLDALPFRYRSYQLVEEKSFDLDWSAPAQIELPGSRSLQVTPRHLAPDGRIKVHLEVLGEHPEHTQKLHTDYSIARGGTLLVGGFKLDPQHPDAGTLLIAITQAVEK